MANTLTFSGRQTIADNTDGAGLLDELRQQFAFDPAGRCCGVIGAGGAARAVVLALAEAGARELLVVNRSTPHAFRTAALARAPGGWPARWSSMPPTSSSRRRRRPWTARGRCSWIHPVSVRVRSSSISSTTRRSPPWLALAAGNGARTAHGLGMLVHQAARQVELWAGCPAPIDVMWEAIGGRSGPVPD